jgi:ElaB/YqjD/DUF883 family membrane-anchored ribosome-binding protein
VSEAEAKRARIKDKIAASQERLRLGKPGAPVLLPLADDYPPEDVRSLAGQYPWLTVAAGAGMGLLLGALLPKKAGSKLGKRAITLATIGAELGLALSKQARERAGEAGRNGLARLGDLGETIGENTGEFRRRAGRAAGSARSTGLTLARQAIKLAARARR